MARRARSRRKLAIWAALPPYLGGKRRLCPLIFREVDRVLPRRLWRGRTFLDGFLGGGSVSLYAKAQGFNVVATDIAERAITIGNAVIANSRVRLSYEDVVRVAAPHEGAVGRIERDYTPAVFTKEQGRFIDGALAVAARTEDVAKDALFRLLAVRVALLAHPYSQVRRGTIHRLATGEYESITESAVYHYVDGLRLVRPEKLWALAQQINAGIFQGEARILRASVLDILPSIAADVAYFDPPYPGVMSYEREYKVIDEILEGASRPTSPFTARDGAAMIDRLFERALHIPIWLLSLGNAVVTLADLEEKMACLGRRTRAIEIKYQHLPAVATDEKKEKNREYLVVGWDPDSGLLRELSRASSRQGVAEDLYQARVPLDADIDALDARGLAGEKSLLDASDHREQGCVLGALPSGTADSGGKSDPAHDGESAVLDEPAVDVHGEFQLSAVIRHRSPSHPGRPIPRA